MQGRALTAALSTAVAACLVVPGAASATGTLDQQQLLQNGFGQVQSGQSLGQTITAGISGGMDQVDVMLQCGGPCPPTAPLTVEIRNVAGGFPGATVLAASSVPAAGVSAAPAFVPVTFATPAPVTAGTQYAIVLHSATGVGNHFAWASASSAPYAAGAGYFAASSPPTTAWLPGTGFDQTFKTYVTPAAALPTGQRAAALKKCKKKRKKLDWSKKRYKKCKRNANKLPV